MPQRPQFAWRGIVIGLFIGMALFKLGNPVTLDHVMSKPNGMLEVAVLSWPVAWGLLLLAPTLFAAFSGGARFQLPKPAWLFLALWVWFGWCVLSSARSVDPNLSRLTLLQFSAAVTIFTMGLWGLGQGRERLFFRTLIPFFVLLLWLGFDQHYGGLEATRKMFFESPNWEKFPKEYIAKIKSDRIFSTLVYPNAFAGVILLWLPVLTLALWDWLQRLPQIARMVIAGLFIYMAAACFYWTGSKAGWLIALAIAGIALLHAPMKRSARIAIIVAVAIVGLGAFAVKYQSYFEKGATSANARFIYWQSASKIALERPVFGSGPGTFGVLFKTMKPPEAEMARLVHNDYLEQASDSGWLAAIAFLAFVGGGLALTYSVARRSPIQFAVWLGLVGWALQGFVEFGLYIPAIAWSAFLLMGWLLSGRIPVDNAPAKP